MWTCPVCGAEFDDSDVYFLHLVESKSTMLMRTLSEEFTELNLKHPAQFPSFAQFIRTWVAKQ